MTPTKRCSACHHDLPLEAFHRRRHYVRTGVRAACRACTAQQARQRRQRPGPNADRGKDAVRARTRLAIARGQLVPTACVVCGDPHVEAHHPAYDTPDAWLHVQWLCRLHHAEQHGVRAWTRQLDLLAAPGPVAPTATTRVG